MDIELIIESIKETSLIHYRDGDNDNIARLNFQVESLETKLREIVWNYESKIKNLQIELTHIKKELEDICNGNPNRT